MNIYMMKKKNVYTYININNKIFPQQFKTQRIFELAYFNNLNKMREKQK